MIIQNNRLKVSSLANTDSNPRETPRRVVTTTILSLISQESQSLIFLGIKVTAISAGEKLQEDKCCWAIWVGFPMLVREAVTRITWKSMRRGASTWK